MLKPAPVQDYFIMSTNKSNFNQLNFRIIIDIEGMLKKPSPFSINFSPLITYILSPHVITDIG